MIYLRNKNELDIAGLTIMGAHAKVTENPIGRFGSGLKYAVSGLLREEVHFDLWIGMNKFTFGTEEIDLRGTTLEQVVMYGEYDKRVLPMTLLQGQDWELWQFYREIHSNCIDEPEYEISTSPLEPKEGYTLFVIDLPDEILGDTFLEYKGKDLLYSNADVDIYAGESDVLYYQGIRAYDLARPSKLTYNIKAISTLTEDRCLAHSFQADKVITNAFGTCTDKDLIIEAITASSDYHEFHLDSTWQPVTPGEVFKEAAKEHSPVVNNAFAQYVSATTPDPDPTAQEKHKEVLTDLVRFLEEHDITITKVGDKFTIDGGGLELSHHIDGGYDDSGEDPTDLLDLIDDGSPAKIDLPF